MSASLVGSEMCIRDRRTSTAIRRTGRSGPSSSSAGCPSSTAATTTTWTVSYTHLTLPTICSV
eukprot:7142246-Alexandrium_andersonii.AAC.1